MTYEFFIVSYTVLLDGEKIHHGKIGRAAKNFESLYIGYEYVVKERYRKRFISLETISFIAVDIKSASNEEYLDFVLKTRTFIIA